MRRLAPVQVLVLVVMLLLAAPAHGTIYSVAPADRDGPDDSFTTNEALWVIGVSNPVEGAAQVCVVPASVTSGRCTEDAIWGRPNVISVLGTFHQPIVSPWLAPGTYRILADNDDDPDDDNTPDIVSQPFTVTRCVADDCSAAVGEADLAEWKAAAEAARLGAAVLCASASIYELTSAGAVAAGGATLSSGLREVILADIKGDDEDLDLKKPSGSKRKAINFLRKVACGTFLMLDDIVHDPPDPDYKHVSEPEPDYLGWQLSDIPEVNAAASTLETARADGIAHRIGVERYQGARAAQDAGWAAVHAKRIGEQALATQASLRKLGRQLRAAADALDEPGLEPPSAAEIAQARAARERVRASGFSAGERAQLAALGLDESEIADVRAQLGAPLPEAPIVAVGDAARAAADAIDTATCVDDGDRCGFDLLGRTAGAVGADTAVAPTVTFSDVVVVEGDRGLNHARGSLTLSHPADGDVWGAALFDRGTFDEGEVVPVTLGWRIDAGSLRADVSFVVTNDTAPEGDESGTVSVVANGAEVAGEAAVTVRDDDGPDAPPKPKPAARGLLAWLEPGVADATLMMAEPDGTNLVEINRRAAYHKHTVVDWSDDGRLLLLQYQPSGLQEQGTTGQPLFTLRIGEDGQVLGAPTQLTPRFPLASGASFAPDGRRVAMAQSIESNWVLAVQRLDAQGRPVGMAHVTGHDAPLAGWYATSAAWSPSGDRLAFSGCSPGGAECGAYTVAIDADGRALSAPVAVSTSSDLLFDAWGPWTSWSPDGRFVTALGGEREHPELRAVGPSGSSAVLAPRTMAPNGVAVWAPDSRGVAIHAQRDPWTGAPADLWVIRSLDAAGAPLEPLRELRPHGWHFAFGIGVAWSHLPDDTPPVTTAEIRPGANANGWHRDDVTVALKATDPGERGEVTQVQWSLDGAPARQASGAAATVVVGGEGVRTLRYWAVDARGNAESPKTLTIRIDRTPPQATIASPAGGYPLGATVVADFACADALSGVASCAGVAALGAALPTGTSGARAFGVAAVDRAGNEAHVASAWSVSAPPDDQTSVKPRPGTKAATLPSNRRCVSRRRFRIRLARPAGDPLRSARVTVNGKRVRVVRGRRLTAPVDLRGLPKGRFVVRIVATTKSGRKLVSKRAYRTCAAKRPRSAA